MDIPNLDKRKKDLRDLIPKKKDGTPKTDRLEKLDSMLYSSKFTNDDLDFIEKEILSAVQFFKEKENSKARKILSPTT